MRPSSEVHPLHSCWVSLHVLCCRSCEERRRNPDLEALPVPEPATPELRCFCLEDRNTQAWGRSWDCNFSRQGGRSVEFEKETLQLKSLGLETAIKATAAADPDKVTHVHCSSQHPVCIPIASTLNFNARFPGGRPVQDFPVLQTLTAEVDAEGSCLCSIAGRWPLN